MDQAQLIELGCLIAILVLSLGLHEYAHALVAHLRGDDTAKELGRLTVNPIAHIDPFLTILLPGILYATTGLIFGGARPVPVVPGRLRHPLRDMMLVALAGPLMNLLLAVAFMLLWKSSVAFWGYSEGELLPQVLLKAHFFNVLLTVFNLLPLPPLDGSRVMAYILPQSLREPYVGLERLGLLLVFGLIYFVPGTRELLFDTVFALREYFYELTGGDWTR